VYGKLLDAINHQVCCEFLILYLVPEYAISKDAFLLIMEKSFGS
jgi:hypothetical protein